ncbi:hypothetical protein SAMN06265370_13711 [Puniceibacterium sediminis]|uniref:Oligosaccharide repeat unit polymerase n=1 Tax=Puniceibacterium sediminis TaxID=1608407 RepID=A0A238ZPR9_9RHOB|nr:hypothetical protein SAMN06265370_13711 [Puniceibacterium sediminis]
MRKLLMISPIVLVIVIWAVTLAVAALPFAFPERFDIAIELLERQHLTVEDFSATGAAWLAVAFIVFVCASIVTMLALPSKPKPFETNIDLDRVARAAFILNAVFVTITLLWVSLTAQSMGGFRTMLLLVQLDALEAREALLDNKLFTGMRVIYASLPATGAIAATILAAGKRQGGLSPKYRQLCLISFSVNLVMLALLPIVMSQRLLLLQLIMAAYFSTCMVHRRLIGLQYLPIGFVLFMSTWIGRESVTNATIGASPIEVGFEKLVFYFSNDLLNSFMPLNREFDHTYGFFTFKFATYFTQTDGFFRSLLVDQLEAVDAIRGGGAWSIFTMPYVDFGAVGASLYIAAIAVISAIVFHKGVESISGAAIYGLFAGGYVLCTHTLYFANTNFVAMVMITAFIGSFAKPRQQSRNALTVQPAE